MNGYTVRGSKNRSMGVVNITADRNGSYEMKLRAFWEIKRNTGHYTETLTSLAWRAT
jgi:hypothetical protein